jgi:hypothetical protein
MVRCRLHSAFRKAIEHVILALVDVVTRAFRAGGSAAKPAINKGISARGRFRISLLQVV